MLIQLEINVKHIKKEISDFVDDYLFDNFEQEVFKRAGVKKKDIVEAILNDQSTIADIQKHLQRWYYESMSVAFDDIRYEWDIPLPLEEAYDKCDKVADDICHENLEKYNSKKQEEEHQKTLELIKSLEKKGYSVTKN
jgi:hypothetical protein